VAKHKIITFTGTDLVGKATQSTLLSKVLDPSKRLEFPDYAHWSGRIIRSILRGEEFFIAGKTSSYKYQEEKMPEVYQALQFINRMVNQDKIEKGLKKHHWVMDRYEIDSLAYGLSDGIPMEFITPLVKCYCQQSDHIIFLRGQAPFSRPDEVKDVNERNSELQRRVVDVFEMMTWQDPRFVMIDATQSVDAVHQAVVTAVNKFLPKVGVEPMTKKKIDEFMKEKNNGASTDSVLLPG
jgi:thymidylate kinase